VYGVVLRREWRGACVEVSADSLYEAVAQDLRVFRENDWIHEIGRGQTTISVAVSHPEVQHKVRIQDFERWLESQGRTPAEMMEWTQPSIDLAAYCESQNAKTFEAASKIEGGSLQGGD
jgi:hypothetical protein